jgi:hypothetical protein
MGEGVGPGLYDAKGTVGEQVVPGEYEAYPITIYVVMKGTRASLYFNSSKLKGNDIILVRDNGEEQICFTLDYIIRRPNTFVFAISVPDTWIDPELKLTSKAPSVGEFKRNVQIPVELVSEVYYVNEHSELVKVY